MTQIKPVGRLLMRVIRAIWIATRFLTRFPLPDPYPITPNESGQAALTYPIVGLLLGALLGCFAWLFAMWISQSAAIAIIIAWVWLTGSLHLDGLADCADAWVGGLGNRERTFMILKDPHLGTMGATAIVLVLLTKWSAIHSLLTTSQTLAITALIWTPLLARSQLLLLAVTTAAARPDGLGAALRQYLPRRSAWAVFIVVILATVGWFQFQSVLILSVMVAVFFIWRYSMCHRLGGFTGDTAGALIELTEAAVLFTFIP
ncbi:adenosylcobinamide-GDP ribazoletransferase [Thiospirillum jenense]|uniref:Adenosylcobinamide-GDP ribazoletransferase n=1 Tax=Thiospirillum jenense TaxID=1653858 RepID=A0A839HI50_9GAMM|nr:adenosylcobinamide-GDP ribazoletransferase [Thiospirillum jenense]MBB1126429.1 adenosylcobinamide-GDP ribazoletransferase [Thiospirillum jenense]